ncbi:hypothetical protein HYX04_02725 [Candidatus Woesearchaeota archaeon]|nr:hypothetical protein [Candidatus Woesearchaeota archaeon]
MENLVNRLEKKGWSKKEIIKAVGIIRNAKQSKGKDIIFIEKRIYWILLAIIIAANFAISVALMPILMSLKGIFLYLVIITFGIVFGLLFELVIRSIEHLEKRHHQLLAVLIPLIALANAFVISKISNNLSNTLQLKNFQNPILISVIYAASFVLPYIIYRFVLKIEYYAKE